MKSPFNTPMARWLPWLGALFLLGAALRLVNLDAPPLDFHPTRHLRNSLVARAIYYQRLGDAEPEKLALAQSFRRAVGQYEPPIVETIVGRTFLAMDGESFAVARVYGTLFWLLAGVAWFDLGRRMASAPSALIALAYYLVLPFGVQASRSFQPDPLMTSAFVAGIYALYRWSENPRWRWALLGAAFAGLAVLVKIVIVFLVAGAAVAAVLTGLGGRFWRSPQVWVMADLMILPSATYYPSDERILSESEKAVQRRQPAHRQRGRIERVVAAACKEKGISLTELRSGSRRGILPQTRAELVCKLIENFGVPCAEVAHQVGISTSGVSKILSRGLSS